MPIELTPAALRSYRDRRWDLVREAKQAHWQVEARTLGPISGFEVGAALWAHARQIDPAWPSCEQRCEDLDHHRALAAKLRAVASVFTGR